MTVITLNDKQIAVLRSIADGCPDGVMEGYSHRVSAAALRLPRTGADIGARTDLARGDH